MSADEIDAHPTWIKRLEIIRRQAADAMGIKASGSIPKTGIVSSPSSHQVQSGRNLDSKSCDLVVRAISVGQPYRAVPITVAMALASAAKLEGSVVSRCVAERLVDDGGITIGHNSGTILVGARFDAAGKVESATIFRTARRLMDDTVSYS